ncbi:MAG TPA: ABC transporter permease [Anaerolineae bacterium]|nr:ABC transporter permease [Anaerolineae bacterium]
MTRYVIRRLLQAIPTFLGITVLTFAIVYLAPGDPVLQQTFNPRISTATREELNRRLGLDQPLTAQYLTWLIGNEWQADTELLPRKGILRGDFGVSFIEHRPVLEIIGDRLGATLLLTGTATLIGYALGIPIGVYAAVRRGSFFDNLSRILAVIFNSIPGFWLSLILILVFAVKFREWNLPAIASGGMYTVRPGVDQGINFLDRLVHLLPPALVLATGPIATVSRLMRTQVLEVIQQDYVRTARAKGVSERRVYYTHALRNALIPLATILGPTLTGLIGGAVITETVWSWPGLGRLFVNANFQRDYPVIMAGFVIGAVGVIVGNLLSDMLYGWIDPRVRLT